MLKVACELSVYEDSTIPEEKIFAVKPTVKVYSHWNKNELVVLEVGERKVTVCAKDLIAAVENCTNVPRF